MSTDSFHGGLVDSDDDRPASAVVLAGNLATAEDQERIRNALEGVVKPEAIVRE